MINYWGGGVKTGLTGIRSRPSSGNGSNTEEIPNQEHFRRRRFNVKHVMKRHITQTHICNVLEFFTAVKTIIFNKIYRYLSFFNEAVLTSTHNLSFRAKVSK